ncbi:MAG: dTDP-4-dehydrorhamnose 3,5-epimerase family protein, partial [Pseudomonadota bacterium]
MEIIPTQIPDVKLIVPKRHGDHRGFFSEVYNTKTLRDAGIEIDFVQDNHS